VLRQLGGPPPGIVLRMCQACRVVLGRMRGAVCKQQKQGKASVVSSPSHPSLPSHCYPPRRDCAWGWDELQPLSCQGAHWLNLSLTLVDSLDTLYLTGLHREFEEAAE
jgi:hypothetical protein